jgi:hypothetical protein
MPIKKPIGLVNKKTGKLWAGENYGEQSQESYDKLLVAGKLNPVQQGIDRFGNYLTTSAQADPIVGPVLKFLGAGVRTITNVLPKPIKQGVGFVLEKNQEAAENIAAATGLPVSLTDPMTIADAVMGGAVTATRPAVKTAVRETLQGAATIGRNLPPPGPQLVPVGAGSAPRVQLNVSRGKANLDLAPQVMNLTIKNSDNLARGAAQGWAAGPEFGEEMTRWRNRRMELREQMRNPSGLTAARRKKNKTKSLITAYNDVSTAATRLPDNPVAYDKTPFKKFSDLELRNMEQHHLFPKQESYQFVERMLELGDEDDVLNLMIFAEEMDASMGGRLANMLNMERQPHKLLHSSRKAIEDGRQLKSLEMKNLIENAKSSDELMELFKTYIETNIRPSKDEAFALNDLYEIAKKQGKHEEMYKALKNKGR